MSEAEKTRYRAAIRLEWKKIVKRGRFSSHEYKLIEGYFSRGVPVEIIVRAMKQAVERATDQRKTVYSLGFINSDIFALLRQTAQTNVGAAQGGDWRPAYAHDIEDLMSDCKNPDAIHHLSKLKVALPRLTRSQANARYQRIDQRFLR